MKYADITKANAKAAAEQGLIPALKWTIAKYKLYSRCAESRWESLEVYGYHCPLCHMFSIAHGYSDKCRNCPLGPKRQDADCCIQWRKVKFSETYEQFRNACAALANRLERELKRAKKRAKP